MIGSMSCTRVTGSITGKSEDVEITMLFKPNCNASSVPVISPPLAAIVKSTGSINQVPFSPIAAAVVITAPFATLTCAAEVSMKPPLPPVGALASSVPPTLTVPVFMSPIKRIVPPTFCMVRARITPVLFTTAVVSASAAFADITI